MARRIRFCELGQFKIENLGHGLAAENLFDHDVAGLDVPLQHTHLMRMRQRIGRLEHDIESQSQRYAIRDLPASFQRCTP